MAVGGCGTVAHGMALAEVQGLVQAGRLGAAVRRLSDVLAWTRCGRDHLPAGSVRGAARPDRGGCQGLGSYPARLPLAPRALKARAEVLADRGQFAEIEVLLTQALRDPRIDGSELRRYLVRLYTQEGRLEEARRLIDAVWEGLNRAGRGGAARPSNSFGFITPWKRGWRPPRRFTTNWIRSAPRPRGRSDLAGEGEPGDPPRRVYEAAKWLDACLRKRPEDVPVWQARLDWALGVGRVPEVWEALGHLPVDTASPAQVHRLAAWFAAASGGYRIRAERARAAPARRGSPGGGRHRPAGRTGEPGGPAGPRRRTRTGKGGAPPARPAIQELLRQPAVRDAVRLARLAEQLGRWFEARVFSDLAVSA